MHTVLLSALVLARAHAWRPAQPRLTRAPRVSVPRACASPPPGGPCRTVHVILPAPSLSASSWGLRQKERRAVGVQTLPDAIFRGDPVPVMILAAAVAAIWPVLSRVACALARPRRVPGGGRHVAPPGAEADRYRPDGALDDPRTIEAARALLGRWDAGDESALRGAPPAEAIAAVGTAFLEFVFAQTEDLDALQRLRRLIDAAPVLAADEDSDAADGGGLASLAWRQQRRGSGRGAAAEAPRSAGAAALRMASTAASRRALGAGRGGGEAKASAKDGYAGALLLLCGALLRGDEAAAGAAAVRQGFFASSGEEGRGERLRLSAAHRMARYTARKAMPHRATSRAAPLAGAGACITLQALQELASRTAPLPTALGYGASAFVGPLLDEARPLQRAMLEDALAAWLAAGGGNGATDGADDGADDGAAAAAAAAAAQPSQPEARRAAYAVAGSAARLCGACLSYADGAGTSPDPPPSPYTPAAEVASSAAVRSVGIPSASRHPFYGAFASAAAIDELELGLGLRAPLAAGAQSTLSAADAPHLRSLLQVLPASALRDGQAALAAAAGRAASLGRLDEAAPSIGRIAALLGVDVGRADAIVARAAGGGGSLRGETR